MERAAAHRDVADPGDDQEPATPDLLTIGLLVFFVSLVIVVAAMLLIPAVV